MKRPVAIILGIFIFPFLSHAGSEMVTSKATPKEVYVLELCNKVRANPKGAWTEYWWPKPGYDQPQRRISFIMQVPDQPYQVISSTYDDNTSLENLDKISKRATLGSD